MIIPILSCRTVTVAKADLVQLNVLHILTGLPWSSLRYIRNDKAPVTNQTCERIKMNIRLYLFFENLSPPDFCSPLP
jgi:hypothetical protein